MAECYNCFISSSKYCQIVFTCMNDILLGDLCQFEDLRPFWEQQPDLFKNQTMLLRKIRLLSLMELIFRRHAHDRTISFSDIAKGASIDKIEVHITNILIINLLIYS
ncbi:26S proteasome non-ATPase regulatory subunit 13 [Geodia barretti]|uniref:26S proteasome non-ATPase regulatory subunit 13 n=1 Tax=Geodia barretti TaxID=519541 RepID=A0AA35TAG8_GEOBA|nr:26S proteasome non-ATPase regulatory subunit 13 [Geodia barretti]